MLEERVRPECSETQAVRRRVGADIVRGEGLESKIGGQPRGVEGGEETATCLKPGKQPRSEAAHVVDPEHVQARQVHGIERRHDTGLDVSEAAQHFCDCSVLPGRRNRDDAPQS
jgi:hypothetical protein